MLSSNEFAELVTVIQTTRIEGPKPEVRRTTRLEHACRITIWLPPDDKPESAQIVQLKDISARGMCFMHNEPLPNGTNFIVKLEAENGASVSILATAVHSRQLDANTWQIGTEFTRVQGHAEEPEHEQAPEDQMHIRRPVLH